MEIRPILSALLRSKTGAVLVAAQVALTLAIVANAAFIVRTKLAATERPSGADEQNLFDLGFVGSRPIADRQAMMQKDLETLRAIPGVVGATSINQVPFGQSGWGSGLITDKTNFDSGHDTAMYLGDQSLIPTLGLQLVEGRNFTEDDVVYMDDKVESPKIRSVIVTRSMGKAMFPDATSYVGKTVWDGNSEKSNEMQIVGVVDKLISPWAPNSSDAYDSTIMPVRLLGDRARYAIRTAPGQRARVMKAAEAALAGLRPDRVKVRNQTYDAIRESRFKQDKTASGMLIAVAIGLLLVTGSGIVGVASLWVSQRKKQIGVRRALGAGRIDILRYFVTENLLITTVGVALGVGLAIGVNQFLISKLSMTKLPVEYLIGGVVALWTLGIVAVLGPAWRAAAVPPAIATRSA
jgi:putative ABC transport system permease protein